MIKPKSAKKAYFKIKLLDLKPFLTLKKQKPIKCNKNKKTIKTPTSPPKKKKVAK